MAELEPEEVASFRAAPEGSSPEPPLEGLEHRVAPRTQARPQEFEVRLEAAARDELGNRRLSEERRRDVGGHGALLERARIGGRKHEVAGAQAGGDRLRERRGVRDEIA